MEFHKKNNEIGKNKFLGKIGLKYQIIPLSLEISKKSAEIRASTKLKLPDAIIYATAMDSKVDVLISNDILLIKKGNIPIMTPKDFVHKYVEST